MKKSIIILCFSIFQSTLFAQNLVKNPGFEELNTNEPNPKVHCNFKNTWGGSTPALGWYCWVNSPSPNGCMFTEVVKHGSQCVPMLNKEQGNMLHVITVNSNSSSIQFNPIQPEYQQVKISCWVYVLKGKIGIGAGNGGNTSVSAWSSTTCKWEFLETTNSVSPANNLIIGGHDATEFYIDNVSVVPIKK